jgi:hypothetical protein
VIAHFINILLFLVFMLDYVVIEIEFDWLRLNSMKSGLSFGGMRWLNGIEKPVPCFIDS